MGAGAQACVSSLLGRAVLSLGRPAPHPGRGPDPGTVSCSAGPGTSCRPFSETHCGLWDLGVAVHAGEQVCGAAGGPHPPPASLHSKVLTGHPGGRAVTSSLPCPISHCRQDQLLLGSQPNLLFLLVGGEEGTPSPQESPGSVWAAGRAWHGQVESRRGRFPGASSTGLLLTSVLGARPVLHPADPSPPWWTLACRSGLSGV